MVSSSSSSEESDAASSVRSYVESMLSYLARWYLKEKTKKEEERQEGDGSTGLEGFPIQLLDCNSLREFLAR